MEDNPDYFGSYIYRYTWNEDFFYEVTIPLSSCVYCDTYDIDGNRLNWQENDFEDYRANISERKLIWQNPNTWL